MLVVACVSLVLNLLEIYHLGWKKVKHGVTNEFVPDSDSLLLSAEEPGGDAETIPEQTSPSAHDCIATYASMSVVVGGAAEGGVYTPNESTPTVISLNPNMARAPMPAGLKMDGAAFQPDDFLLEALPVSFYSNSEKMSVGSHGQLAVMEQNWNNMALELHNLNSSSSYPPPLPSPPSSTSSSSPQEETNPPLPYEYEHSSFPTLPRNTPLSTLIPEETTAEEERAPCTVPRDDFTVVTRAEMHRPPAATDIRKPSRASKSGVRARPDDLAV